LGSSSEDVLSEPVSGGHGLTTEERRSVDRSNEIAGWGSDLDPTVRPGVPRDKAPEIGVESLYPDIPQQLPVTRIHKSTEHARLTPVFGTSCPPAGLSGKLRDVAYRYSEGKFAHWLTLMLADRVNVVEDLLNDLVHLRVPNIPKEMGIRSAWRYDRAAVVRKAAIVGIVIGALIVYSRARRARR
jgi:hypothetical protein